MSRVTGSRSLHDPSAPGKRSATEPYSQGLTKLTKLALSFLSLYLSLLGSWGTYRLGVSGPEHAATPLNSWLRYHLVPPLDQGSF